KLLRHGPDRFRGQRDRHDRMFRFKILQVRLEHPEEKIDLVGRLRDFENTNMCFLARTGSSSRSPSRTGTSQSRLVFVRTRKGDAQGQLAGDQINAAQSNGELFEKAPENEKQRLGGFDLMIELKTFIERFRRLNKF